MNKEKVKLFIVCLVIPLAVGGLSALITRNGMEKFDTVKQPILTPPEIVFPIVWTLLFVLMGISSYLILQSGGKTVHKALLIYALQLAFNFFWTVFFFSFGTYLFSFVWLVVLWMIILWMISEFYDNNKTAALLQLPYLVWTAFAGYLNLAIYFLNR